MELVRANKARKDFICQKKQGDTMVIEDHADDPPDYSEAVNSSHMLVDTDDDNAVTYTSNSNSNTGAPIAVRNTGHISVVTGFTLPLVGDPPSVFRHAICFANQSERSAYRETISGYANVPKHDSPDCYIATCDERHSACSMCGSGDMFLHQDRKVDLNVLGVSRQLYEEANVLLWKTNTFSFDDPKSFDRFFNSLNPAQKRNFTKIHINAHIGEYFSARTTAAQRSRWDQFYWGKALKMSTMKMLQGVQTLHLCINLGYQGYFPATSRDASDDAIMKLHQADMEPILRLRALSAKKITVIVSDDAKKLEEDGRVAPRWTRTRKNEYAESIRIQLVDEKGAERVKAEAEAANLAKKTLSMDNATATVKRLKRAVPHAQDRVDRAAEWVEEEEANALAAQRKVDESSKKGMKQYATLSQAADEQRGAVDFTKERLDDAVKEMSALQENLAKAKEKRNRAMIRLGATPEDIQDESDVENLMLDFDD